MAKDTFYFSHDYNVRSDKKIKKLLSVHNFLGYGLFWAIIEDLYNNANVLQTDYESIAFDLRADTDLVRSIINDFDLFVVIDGEFGSRSVEERLNKRNLKSAKARESAEYRWGKCERIPNAMQTQSDSNAIKKSKVKKNKENLPISDISAEADKNFEFKEILNPTSFPNWRAECSAFLKDEYFKNQYCKSLKIPMGNLEKSMRDFVVEKNLNNDFKNLAALKVHFGHWYKKYHNNRVNNSSKAFVDIPDDYDYGEMEVW